MSISLEESGLTEKEVSIVGTGLTDHKGWKVIKILMIRELKNFFITKQENEMQKFQIEQIALCPKNPELARKLLSDLGLTEWFCDNVHANGIVRDKAGENDALLQFNYQAGSGADFEAGKPLELELLHYTNGENWMTAAPNTVSHFGMHVDEKTIEEFRAYFKEQGIGVAQEVFTESHTNEKIKDSRRYHYVIFDTREILGVDLKFIVRINLINQVPDE